MGDYMVSGSDERLDQLALGGRVALGYIHGFITPEICNRIHALGFGGPVRRPAVALAAPFGD